jgi:hypothetical protein
MWVDYNAISDRIALKSLRMIGMGSGRVVYDLGDGYVVKKARNKKGLVQNKGEYMIASRNRSELFADVISVSEDYIYLIMKKAEKILSYNEVWKYYNVKNFNELFRLDNLKEIIRKNELLLPDLYRKTSWGIINGRPVLIDYGFTKEVRKYYRFFNI